MHQRCYGGVTIPQCASPINKIYMDFRLNEPHPVHDIWLNLYHIMTRWGGCEELVNFCRSK